MIRKSVESMRNLTFYDYSRHYKGFCICDFFGNYLADIEIASDDNYNVENLYHFAIIFAMIFLFYILHEVYAIITKDDD